MSQQHTLDWDLERRINRITSDYNARQILKELLKSLVTKGIYTQEEVNGLFE